MPETTEASTSSAPKEDEIKPVDPTNTGTSSCSPSPLQLTMPDEPTLQTTGLERGNATRNSRRTRFNPAEPVTSPSPNHQTSTLRRSNATRRSHGPNRPLPPDTAPPIARIITWGETWERPPAQTGPSPSPSIISAHTVDPLEPGDIEMQTVVTDGGRKMVTTVRRASAQRRATRQSRIRTWGGSLCIALAMLVVLSAILWGTFFLVMNDKAKKRGMGILDVTQPRYLQTVGYVNVGLGVLVLVAWAGFKCCWFR